MLQIELFCQFLSLILYQIIKKKIEKMKMNGSYYDNIKV